MLKGEVFQFEITKTIKPDIVDDPYDDSFEDEEKMQIFSNDYEQSNDLELFLPKIIDMILKEFI